MLRGRLTRISGMLRGLRGARRGMRDIRLRNRHGFRAGEIRKMEPQLVPRKARAYRVAQRQVLGVSRFFAVSDGCRVAPAGNPFRKFLWHMPKIANLRWQPPPQRPGSCQVFLDNYSCAEYELHELDYELFAEGVCQLVESLDGRRALRCLETLVRLRGDVCSTRHIAFLLTPARFK